MKLPLMAVASLCVVRTFLNLNILPDSELSNRRQLRGTIGSVLAQSTRRKRRLTESQPIRFAWGIVSHPDDEDIRQALRSTYLSSDPRICVLRDDGAALPLECQIAYTFLLPTSVLEDSGSAAPLFEDAKDITYLPATRDRSLISTWFHYAAHTDVDYVAKVDATTLVFPDLFLEASQDMLGSPDLFRVIGGTPRDRWDCGGFSQWKCRQMVGRTFMSTELYFLSIDLAALVPLDVSDDEPVRLSNWLASSLPQLPTLQVTYQPSHGLWENHSSNTTGIELTERWQYLESQQFSRKLIEPNHSPAPRWQGTSLMDEFYRRIPWKYFPESLTRFNLP